MADTAINEAQFVELQDRIRESIHKHLEAGMVNTPEAREQTAAVLRSTVDSYLEELKDKKTLGYEPVVVGSFTSSVLLKDKGRYPHHKAVAHFSNGVASRTAGFKGKWRRAKPALRAWIESQRDCLAMDMTLYPLPPVEYLVAATIEKPLAEDM